MARQKRVSKTTKATKIELVVRDAPHFDQGGLKYADDPQRSSQSFHPETQDILRSLNILQSSATEWLDGTSIDVGVHFQLDSNWLPGAVRDEINYTNTWPAGFWNDQHHGAAGLADFHRMREEIIDPALGDPDFIDLIRERQYTIWPINAGKHWSVIIIRTEPMTISENPTNRRLVTHIAVVDSAKHEKTMNLVYRRTKEFLEYHDFVVADSCRTEVWTPKQNDCWSCGIHAYHVSMVMIERIKHVVLNKEPGQYSNDIWKPLSRDFQPSKVRMELIGLMAVAALAKEDYTAKIGLVQATHARDRTGVWRPARELKPSGRLQVYKKPPK